MLSSRLCSLERLSGIRAAGATRAMTTGDGSGYALGYADVEHDRLIRQARRFAPLTESFLRDAGLREGLRVLDLGSGIGDVALLVAQIVGTRGAVLGVERDLRSIERARRRVDEAGYTNVTFHNSDVAAIPHSASYDAVVGRFILQYVPEPAALLHSVLKLVRPRGIVAFQEVAWAPALAANTQLGLWSACAATVHDTLVNTGADSDIGLQLNRIFVDAGVQDSRLKLDMLVGTSAELVLWPYDLLASLAAAAPIDVPTDRLGDFGTLADRMLAEAADARVAVTSVGVVSAWALTTEA